MSNSFLLLNCINIKEETCRSNPTTMSIIIIKLLSNQKTGKKNQQGQHFKASNAMTVNKECGIFLKLCGKLILIKHYPSACWTLGVDCGGTNTKVT